MAYSAWYASSILARSRSISLFSDRIAATSPPRSPDQDSNDETDQAVAQARQRHVGVNLIKANLNMPRPDLPATQHIVPIVRPGEQVAKPRQAVPP